MENNQTTFQRNLLVCLATASALCIAVELICRLVGIAPFFTPNVPLDEKLRFVRDHRPGPAPIGVISGASIALNDVDSDLLQDEEHQPFINLGASGLSIDSSAHLFKQFANMFAVREVIFALEPFELRNGFRADVSVPTDVLRRYLSGKMTIAEDFTYRDIPGLLAYWKNWQDYRSPTRSTSLLFSNTGDVPLQIGRENADPQQWNGDAIGQNTACVHCTDSLDTFCREVRAQGVTFTVVLGPLRSAVLERLPDLREVDSDRRIRIRSILQGCGGGWFDVNDFATLDDTCFANSAHLNSRGMRAMTALFVQFRRRESLTPGELISCPGSPFSADLQSDPGLSR